MEGLVAPRASLPADTPSTRIIAAAASVQEVTDEQGRRLTLRRLNALDKLRLFKAVGPHLAQNAPYLGMAMLAWSVSAIDDVPIPPPANEQQIEALVSRLGDAGIAAAAAAMQEQPESVQTDDVAGNSAGTPI
jgi:hypothetical protein